MAALRRDRGGLQSARAAADHHDVLAAAGRPPDAVAEFPPRLGPLDARDREARVEVADAGLVAADAGPDRRHSARPGLGRHLGIADQCPGHHRGVGVTSAQDQLGVLRLGDPPGHHDRYGDDVLDPRGERGGIAGRVRHRRHDVIRARRGGRGPGHHGDVIEQAVGVERGERLQRLVGGQALVGLRFLADRDPQPDGEVRASAVPGGGDRLAQEPEPVLRRAAVRVRPQVGTRVEELGRQVAVRRDDLDPVEPGPGNPGGGRPVAADHLGDEAGRHLPRHDAEPLVRNRGWRVGHGQRAVGRFHQLPSVVEELLEDSGPVGVHGVGQPGETGNAGVVVGHQHVAAVPRRRVDPGHLDDDQPGSARCPRLLIGDQLAGDLAVDRHHGVVAGGDDPIADRRRPDPQRREQARKVPRLIGLDGGDAARSHVLPCPSPCQDRHRIHSIAAGDGRQCARA